MIIKSFEINKVNLFDNKFILLHGKNEGLKKELISSLIQKYENDKILKYDEKEILENPDNFYNNAIN